MYHFQRVHDVELLLARIRGMGVPELQLKVIFILVFFYFIFYSSPYFFNFTS